MKAYKAVLVLSLLFFLSNLCNFFAFAVFGSASYIIIGVLAVVGIGISGLLAIMDK